MTMYEKLKEAEKLIEEVRKSKKQNIWTQADTVLSELDALMYEVNGRKADVVS